MKTAALLLLPALALASPAIVPKAEGIEELQPCGYKIAPCPVGYECVPVDVECEGRSCPGLCFPTGVGFPTGTLPTATLITNTGLPTATLSVTGLPTTNIAGRAAAPTAAPGVNKRGKQQVPAHAVRRQDEGEEEYVPFPPKDEEEEDLLEIWKDKIGKYKPCGGFRPNPEPCPKDYVCIDAPWTGCGMACDAPGICVKPVMCAGFAGFKCPNEDDICIDWPNDGCDPLRGGADCAGICI